MNYSPLKKDQVVALAKYLDVEFNEADNKDQVVAAIKEGNFDDEDIEFALADLAGDEPEVDPAPEPEVVVIVETKTVPSDQVLIRFIGMNPRYEKGGYVFARKHPFVPVDSEIADLLLLERTKFAMATPAEARLFYQV